MTDCLKQNSWNTFGRLAKTAQQLTYESDIEVKRSIFERYIRSLQDDDSLICAIRIFGNDLYPKNIRLIRTNNRLLGETVSEILEIDYEKVFKPCRKASGNLAETIEKLMVNIPLDQVNITHQECTLTGIMNHLINFKTLNTDDQKETFSKILGYLRGTEIRYFVQLLLTGSLQIGFSYTEVLHSLAALFKTDAQKLRHAAMISGSLGKASILARDNRLSEAEFKLFHPIACMQAAPKDKLSLKNPEQYIVEEKFTGMRCQLHSNGHEVKLFSKESMDISTTFPDVTESYINRSLPAVVLDGVLCNVKDNRILPSYNQFKGKSQYENPDTLSDIMPVIFIAFDILFHKNKSLIKKPLRCRRAELVDFCQTFDIPYSSQFIIENDKHLEQLYNRALQRGNGGLLAKEKNGAYEFGLSEKAWLKFEMPAEPLHAVIMYAHINDDRHDGIISRFTIGIRVDDDSRYDEQFIPIAKLDWNSEKDLIRLNNRIRPLITDRYGTTLGIMPDIVVEIYYDCIKVNRRTKAKYILHHPRPKSIRWDLQPADTHSLKDIEQLFDRQSNRSVSPQYDDPSFQGSINF